MGYGERLYNKKNKTIIVNVGIKDSAFWRMFNFESGERLGSFDELLTTRIKD
jgi:hypothetical protein